MRKFTKLGIVVLVLAMVCSLAACSSGKSAESTGDKTYVVATDTTFAPFEFDSGVGMAISSTNENIKSYSDLKGQKVAVKTGTEGYDFANKIKDEYGFTLSTFEDSANMYEDVKSGNSAACFEDYPVLGYAITKGQPLKLVGDFEKGSSYGFAVSKGQNAELVTMFNKGLENVKASGKYDEILNTYIAK